MIFVAQIGVLSQNTLCMVFAYGRYMELISQNCYLTVVSTNLTEHVFL